MKLFKRFDDFLIDRIFEPFAHWFQRLTGLTNFWLGKLTIMIFVVYLSSLMLIQVKNDPTLIPIAIFVATLLLLPSLLLYNFVFMRLEKEAWRALEHNCANPLRAKSGIRLGIILGNFFFVFWGNRPPSDVAITSLTVITMLYFLACTPLPPGKSKFKKFIEKLASFRIWRPATS